MTGEGALRGGVQNQPADHAWLLRPTCWTFISFLRYDQPVSWIFQTLNAVVDAEIAALPEDMQARLLRFADVIERIGLHALPRDAAKHLEGRLWELRIIGKDGISRAIYVTAAGRRVVVVRVFVKKTQKTPRRELEVAHERAKEIT
jgi:phage-related protein